MRRSHRVRMTLQATCSVAFLTPQIAACGASRFQEAVFAESARTDELILGSLVGPPAPSQPLKRLSTRFCLCCIVLPNPILGKPPEHSWTLDSTHAGTLLSTPSALRLQAWFKSTVGRAVFADTHLTAAAQSPPEARLRSFRREAGTLEGRRGVCPDPRERPGDRAWARRTCLFPGKGIQYGQKASVRTGLGMQESGITRHATCIRATCSAMAGTGKVTRRQLRSSWFLAACLVPSYSALAPTQLTGLGAWGNLAEETREHQQVEAARHLGGGAKSPERI
jgi:hypothetical protein